VQILNQILHQIVCEEAAEKGKNQAKFAVRAESCAKKQWHKQLRGNQSLRNSGALPYRFSDFQAPSTASHDK